MTFNSLKIWCSGCFLFVRPMNPGGLDSSGTLAIVVRVVTWVSPAKLPRRRSQRREHRGGKLRERYPVWRGSLQPARLASFHSLHGEFPGIAVPAFSYRSLAVTMSWRLIRMKANFWWRPDVFPSMTRAALILLFAGSLAGPMVTAADFKEFKKTVPLDANGRFTLDTYKGSIRVTAWDQPQVHPGAHRRRLQQLVSGAGGGRRNPGGSHFGERPREDRISPGPLVAG